MTRLSSSGISRPDGQPFKSGIAPEAVLTNDQWSHIEKLANGGRNGPLVHIENVSTTVDLDMIARHAEFRERAGHLG